MRGCLVELDDVCLRLQGRPVLEHVDLRLERGDYLAILGPNGGGKTTLLRVLLGLVKPDTGRVAILGGPARSAAGRVGYVPQIRAFDPDFPIRVIDVVAMGGLRQGGWGRLGGAARRQSHAALERVEAAHLAERPIGNLSGGELQRVLIARALIGEPELLLLDEPTSSLDERVGKNVWDLFEELNRELTLVVVSHDIGAVSDHVKSVACLNRRLYTHPSRALTQEMMEAAYGGAVELVEHGHAHGGSGEGRES